MSDEVTRTEEPHDRLTRLCAAMTSIRDRQAARERRGSL